jgi:hypothetical protein
MKREPMEIEAFLAAASLALFAATTFVVLFSLVPAENEKYAMLLLGALIGIVKDTFARYFNVTKGASIQRDTIADMAKVVANSTPASGTATVTAAADVDVELRNAEPDKKT